MRYLVLASCFAAFFAVPVLAEEAPRTLTVSGVGEIEAPPDMATIGLGAVAEAKTAAQALAQTNAITAAIIARLVAAGVEARDMQTSNLVVQPLYSTRPSTTSEQRITGFRASNTLTVRVRDLDGLGEVLDAVAEDGANSFQNLTFGLQNPDPVEDEARVAAVQDALAKAQLLADAAGIALGPILTFSENSAGRGPVMMADAMSRSAGAVPVAAGALTVRAEVNIVFQITGD